MHRNEPRVICDWVYMSGQRFVADYFALYSDCRIEQQSLPDEEIDEEQARRDSELLGS